MYSDHGPPGVMFASVELGIEPFALNPDERYFCRWGLI